jgi:hypothetical protein
MLAQSVNDCDNAPQRSIRLPDLEKEIQSFGAAESGLPMLDHATIWCCPVVAQYPYSSLRRRKGEEKEEKENKQ